MLIINLIGLGLIALIVWWFWLYKPKALNVSSETQIIEVENGVYHPAVIQVAAGEGRVLHFLRKDPSPCAETVLLPALEISETLPLNQPKSISLPPLKKGDYDFHCQMQMYRGKIIVS